MAGSLRFRSLPVAWKVIKKIENWPVYFLDLLGMKNSELIYRSRAGIKYIIRGNTTDRGIFSNLILVDEYELNSLELPKDAVLIDIGGQTGSFTVFASSKIDKAYIYEPVPENYEMAIRNVSLNKLEDKVVVENLAVSDKKEKLRIFITKDHTGSHSIFGKGEHIDVKTTTLKEIIDKNKIKKCDFLKMDVEGSEYKILYGLPDSYFDKIKRIRMETHDIDEEFNHKSLIKFLKAKGYRIVYKHPILFAEKF